MNDTITLFKLIVDFCTSFVQRCSSLFSTIVSILVSPISDLIREFDIISDITLPDFLDITLLEFMFGTGFIIFVSVTLLKWFLGIVK